MENKYSRYYDTAKIELDPRFIMCRNDLLVVELVYLGSIFLIFVLAYTLSPLDITNMKYLFGYPLWVAVCTGICILDVIFVIIWAIKRKKFSLAPRADSSEILDDGH